MSHTHTPAETGPAHELAALINNARVMSHIYISHVAHVRESCHTYIHRQEECPAYGLSAPITHESCHTYT